MIISTLCNNSGSLKIIIWFKGGMFYKYSSNFPQVSQYINGCLMIENRIYQMKTSINDCVNSTGPNISQDLSGMDHIGVGIGNPEYKIDVVDIVHTHEILVNTQKDADFVFEENYPLRPLLEVEQIEGLKSELKELRKTGNSINL